MGLSALGRHNVSTMSCKDVAESDMLTLGVIVGVDGSIIFLHLEIRSGLQFSPRLLVQFREVARATTQRAPMDEVEFADSWEVPTILEVIHVELGIWGDKAGLDGGEIGAYDGSAGKLL